MDETTINQNSSPWKFIGLSLLLTWVCWIPAGMPIFEKFGLLTRVLINAGRFMPALVTLYLLYCYKNSEGRRKYWQRLIDIRRISKLWYAVIFLTVPILTATGVISNIIRDGNGVELGNITNIFQNPLSLIPFVISILLYGPLPEEMAWRGYALDVFQSKWNALEASLILGIVWTIWYIPLIFINGSFRHDLGLGTPQFWLYMLVKIPQSVLMTWIYNNNQRSITSAVLFHFMIIIVGEIFELPYQAEMIYIASWWIMAVIVIVVWKPQNLVHTNASV